jgi:CBS domain-containing protein
MTATKKCLLSLTAADLMKRELVEFPEDMPLREAVGRLLQNQIGGAPVVDRRGKCVGVLSTVDVVRLAMKYLGVLGPGGPPRRSTCSFCARVVNSDGREVLLCTLPPGVCPAQAKQPGPGGKELLVCMEPHCVLYGWQVVTVDQLPTEAVRRFMTANPVCVSPQTPIGALARVMIDAHIHRVLVVDAENKPVGIVTSTDLLAALACASEGCERFPDAPDAGAGDLPTALPVGGGCHASGHDGASSRSLARR